MGNLQPTIPGVELGALTLEPFARTQERLPLDIGRLAFDGFVLNSPVANPESPNFDPGFVNSRFDDWVNRAEAA